MKRRERHKLKENRLATWVNELTETAIGHGRQIAFGATAVVVVGGIALGYLYWRARVTDEADAALGVALAVAEAPVVAPPASGSPEAANAPAPQPGTYPTEVAKLEAALPKFRAVVDQYPASAAATAAAYHEAATLAGLGRLEEAAASYQGLVDRAGGDIYGQMAELGLADVRVQQGRTEEAIAIYDRLAAAADTRLPVDAVLVQMARAYRAAGQAEDAARVYKRVVDEFPQSAYLADANAALAEIAPSRQS